MRNVEFGSILTKARLAAGFAQQSDLAGHIGVEQQTVSRWEQGTSRPKLDKLKQIVDVLQMDEKEASNIYKAAGYETESRVQSTFDQPLPLDALSPQSFERFCTALLAKLYPNAEVNRFGDLGHKQDGIDIEAKFADGTYQAFQCKRHASFGPKKVDDAVAELTRSADKKVLLLASTASPDARKATEKHGGWELWDREDITRKLRHEIPMVAQKSLIDVYFKGQRLVLLGEPEPSPWRSTKEFFAGATDLNAGFSQAWELVGRDNENRQLAAFAKSTDSLVLLLTANGGAGKTRLLRALAENLASEGQAVEIYFLSRERLTSKAFDELGPGPKLLICDDAHERDDVTLISEYVANPASKAKLIFSLRPYGLAHLRQQAKWLMLSDAEEIKLFPLSLDQLTALATQALQFFNADAAYAEQLARYTRDCPLATVIGAKVLANKKSHPAFLLSENAFRSELMARLTAQVVEDVSVGLDPKAVGKTLSCVALLQPLQDGDRGVIDTIAKVTKQELHEVAQIVKRLREAGVIFSRAEKSRVAPDLLGDFLIEDVCIDQKGGSTGFAEKVFDAVEGPYIERLLLNLGRLDWKISNGDTRNSHLMDELWSRLHWENEYHSPYIEAAVAVAYYQPREALALARRLIAEKHTGELVAKIIENAAFNSDFLQESCELLWDLGREDVRPENRHPHHGIRVLTELATPRPDKPIAYLSRVVDFAFGLIAADENWTSVHTPIDILEGALKTEGHTTSSTMRAITMKPFIVAQDAMAAERKRITRLLIDLLSHPDPRRAFEAATAIGSALRFPHGQFGARTSDENYDNWKEEFRKTLEDINAFLDKNDVSPAVLTRLAESVSWHAHHAKGMVTMPLAEQILGRLDKGLRAKTIRLLIDGWGHMTRQLDETGNYVGHEKMLGEIVGEILTAYQQPDALRQFLDSCLLEIAATKREIHGAAFILIGRLAALSAPFAKELVTHAMGLPESPMAIYAGSGLAELLRLDYNAAEALVTEILSEGDGPHLWTVAQAYSRFRPLNQYTKTDRRALRQIVSSTQRKVLFAAADAAHQAYGNDKALGIELFLFANLAVDEHVAHSFLLWIVGGNTGPFASFSSAQIEEFLRRLEPLQSLDDHWVQEFIKKSLDREPEITLQFFMRRIEHAITHDNWRYTPLLNRYRDESLGLTVRKDASVWLERLLDWALERSAVGVFKFRFGEFIGSLFGPFNDSFASALESWGLNKTRPHFEIVVAVLNEAKSSFVFEQATFVRRLLRFAQSLGDEALRDAISALFGSAISGMRHGTPGEPFPEDVERHDNAQKMLATLTPSEPAYKLYDAILRESKRSIDDQLREGKIMVESETEDE